MPTRTITPEYQREAARLRKLWDAGALDRDARITSGVVLGDDAPPSTPFVGEVGSRVRKALDSIEADDLPGLVAVYREKEANFATWQARDPAAEWPAQWWFADAATLRANSGWPGPGSCSRQDGWV